MATKEKMEALFNGAKNGDELTAKTLKDYGLNATDITNLSKSGILIRQHRGIYSLNIETIFENGREKLEKGKIEEALALFDDCYKINSKDSFERLVQYAYESIKKGMHEIATICFEKCHELEPNNKMIDFQLLIRAVHSDDYDKTFELFDQLYDTNNPYYKIDNNFYLFVMSEFFVIPEKYREYTKSLKLEDILIPEGDSRYSQNDKQNEIRKLIFKRKFNEARKNLEGLEINTPHDSFAKELLNKAAQAKRDLKKQMCIYIKQKDYERVKQALTEKLLFITLSRDNIYVLKLINEMENITKSQKPPKVAPCESQGIFDLIDAKEYQKAKERYETIIKEKDLDGDSIPLLLLLNDICDLINTFDNSKNDAVEASSVSNELPVVSDSEEIKITSGVVSTSSLLMEPSIASITIYLLQGKVDESLSSLKELLKSFNLSNYEFLVSDLIQIGVIEKSTAEALTVLTAIKNNNYYFDLYTYIKLFYEAVEKKNIPVARLYLDIISNSGKIAGEPVNLNDLYEIYNFLSGESLKPNSGQKVEPKRPTTSLNQKILNRASEAAVGSGVQIVDNDTTSMEASLRVPLKPRVTDGNLTDDELKLIKAKCNMVNASKAIVPLIPKNSNKIDVYIEEIKKHKNVSAFPVRIGTKNQIIIKYQTDIWSKDDLSILKSRAIEQLNCCNYAECLETNLKILEHSDRNYMIYSYLGNIYRKNIKDKAHKEMTILCYQVYQALTGDDKFADFVLSLQDSKIGQERAVQRKIRVNVSEFDNDIYYGIDNFEEIYSYVIASDLGFESACKEKGLDEEQVMIMQLIMARELYSNNYDDKGDLFFKTVEKKPDKTEKVKKIMAEIQAKKKVMQSSATIGKDETEKDTDSGSAPAILKKVPVGKKGKAYVVS